MYVAYNLVQSPRSDVPYILQNNNFPENVIISEGLNPFPPAHGQDSQTTAGGFHIISMSFDNYRPFGRFHRF